MEFERKSPNLDELLTGDSLKGQEIEELKGKPRGKDPQTGNPIIIEKAVDITPFSGSKTEAHLIYSNSGGLKKVWVDGLDKNGNPFSLYFPLIKGIFNPDIVGLQDVATSLDIDPLDLYTIIRVNAS